MPFTNDISKEPRMQAALALGISTVATVAAIASALAALQLNNLENINRDFTRKLNAALAMQVWQASVSERAASGYRCQVFLGLLSRKPKLFQSAVNKEQYSVEDREEQVALKACLDRENKKSIPKLTQALDAKRDYVPTSIVVDDDVSRFVTTSALDYLNFTEAVFMQWKYEIADRCILVAQLGKQTSETMRFVTAALPGFFPGLNAFFSKYKDTATVEKAVASCQRTWETKDSGPTTSR